MLCRRAPGKEFCLCAPHTESSTPHATSASCPCSNQHSTRCLPYYSSVSNRRILSKFDTKYKSFQILLQVLILVQNGQGLQVCFSYDSFLLFFLFYLVLSISLFFLHTSFSFYLLSFSFSLFLQFFFLNYLLPSLCMAIPVAGRSKARRVFDRSKTGIVVSNPTQDMDVCMRLFCLCCSVCR
jgi:hypothetical protein